MRKQPVRPPAWSKWALLMAFAAIAAAVVVTVTTGFVGAVRADDPLGGHQWAGWAAASALVLTSCIPAVARLRRPHGWNTRRRAVTAFRYLIVLVSLAVVCWVAENAFFTDGEEKEFNRWVGWANTVAMVIAFIALVGAPLNRVGPTLWRRRVERDAAAEELAERMLEFWRAEQSRLELNEPAPLTVRWRWADGSLAKNPSDVLSPSGQELWSQSLPIGSLSDLASLLTEGVAAHEVILLGESGAGKTTVAVHLTVSMLQQAVTEPSRPVPVLLRAKDWNPATQTIEDLMRVTLAASWNHPALEGRLSQRFFPVIDGFDELRPEHRTMALTQLRRASSESLPFLVTSQLLTYREAVIGASGEGPVRAAVIVLQPIDVEAVIAFLGPTARPTLAQRWQPLADRLRDEPHGHLAVALRRPLMVWLARTALNTPDQVQALTESRTAGEVSDVLLEQYIQTLYRDQPDLPNDGRQGKKSLRRYRSEAAVKWLTALTAADFDWHRIIPNSSTQRRVAGTLAALAILVPLLIVVRVIEPDRGLVWQVFAAAAPLAVVLKLRAALPAATLSVWAATSSPIVGTAVLAPLFHEGRGRAA